MELTDGVLLHSPPAVRLVHENATGLFVGGSVAVCVGSSLRIEMYFAPKNNCSNYLHHFFFEWHLLLPQQSESEVQLSFQPKHVFVGAFVGGSVGGTGMLVGGGVGGFVGAFVGGSVGGLVGRGVGGFVGAFVGGGVGASVGAFVGGSVGGTGAFVGGGVIGTVGRGVG